jgi:uncharacterized protein (TIGR03032 family)
VRLDTEFIRIPLSFDVARLANEVASVPEERWRPHPQGHPGNSALPLIAVGGDPGNDSTSGSMAPTPDLEGLEYVRQVLASFATVLGRARLMRLEGRSQATLHVDTNYYWAERVRIHVPVLTSPEIEFICEDQSLHMPAGEAWVFDAWRRHNVVNPTGNRRIHLVADTVGSARFWALVAAGYRPFDPVEGRTGDPRAVEHVPGLSPELAFEQSNFPAVMTPWEMRVLASEVVMHGLSPAADPEAIEQLQATLRNFLADWRAQWASDGGGPSGADRRRALLDSLERGIGEVEGRLKLPNGSDPTEIVRQMMIRPALNPGVAAHDSSGRIPGRPAAPPPAPARQRDASSRFERPIFIIAPPRSGTTLAFETLSRSPSVWTIGGESHRIIEGIVSLRPAAHGWESNRLSEGDASEQIKEALCRRFLAELRDRNGGRPAPDGAVRLLEKTPKNALRIPFLNALFPDAVFVYIHREPEESLASMIAAWESGRFVTYPDLPGWQGSLPWSLLLTPGWRKLAGKPLPEVVASQWSTATRVALSDLERLPPERWCVTGYHALVADPRGEIERICRFAGLAWEDPLDEELPLSRHTLTPPDPDKWREHAAELDSVLPALRELAERPRDLLARPIRHRPRGQDELGSESSPYRSTSSEALSEILGELDSSLLLASPDAGKLICLRPTGDRVNTHLRAVEGPGALARSGDRLSVATRAQVVEYHNLPQLIDRIDPPGRHDACFAPRRAQFTGAIGAVDLYYDVDDLWMASARFSCLATLDPDHSFIPRWRPSFITELTAEDRCHLSGVASEGRGPAYVSAFGSSDEPEGWRDSAADGGIVVDCSSGEIVTRGRSMPNSPRLHGGALWICEAGTGQLTRIDKSTGAAEIVAALPGVARGLHVFGQYAFVGLSRPGWARSLPIGERTEELVAGCAVVDLRSGSMAALLQFEDLITEISSVCLLEGLRFPEIAEPGSEAVDSAFVVPEETVAG